MIFWEPACLPEFVLASDEMGWHSAYVVGGGILRVGGGWAQD